MLGGVGVSLSFGEILHLGLAVTYDHYHYFKPLY